MYSRPLRMLAWNANGLGNDYDELTQLLYDEGVDVALLSETFLIPSKPFHINRYKIHRKDRLHNQGGGFAICVRDDISVEPISLPPSTSTEAITVTLILQHSKLTVVSIYKPPNNDLDISLLNFIFRSQHPVLVVGDWNCKHPLWSSHRTNPDGLRLFRFVQNNVLDVYNTTYPTHLDPAAA